MNNYWNKIIAELDRFCKRSRSPYYLLKKKTYKSSYFYKLRAVLISLKNFNGSVATWQNFFRKLLVPK